MLEIDVGNNALWIWLAMHARGIFSSIWFGFFPFYIFVRADERWKLIGLWIYWMKNMQQTWEQINFIIFLERWKIIKIVERVTLQKWPFQSHADRNNKINNFLLTLSLHNFFEHFKWKKSNLTLYSHENAIEKCSMTPTPSVSAH